MPFREPRDEADPDEAIVEIYECSAALQAKWSSCNIIVQRRQPPAVVSKRWRRRTTKVMKFSPDPSSKKWCVKL